MSTLLIAIDEQLLDQDSKEAQVSEEYTLLDLLSRITKEFRSFDRFFEIGELVGYSMSGKEILLLYDSINDLSISVPIEINQILKVLKLF